MKNHILNQLRWKLTLMNTLVLIGLSIFIAVVFYVSAQISREAEINNSLEAYCAQLSGEMKDFEIADWRSLFSKRTGYDDFQEALKKSSISYAVWDETLTPVSVTDSLGLETSQLKVLIQRYFSDNRSGYWITNYKMDEKEIRICMDVTVSEQGTLRVVQVLRDISEVSNNQNASVGMIFGVLFLTAAASALCGYFLSGRALIPIRNNMIRQQEFMADASHELRTPIAVIKTNLEVISENASSTVDSQLEWLHNASKETQRMHKIVEDMMFLARADAGELQENFECIDIDFLCAEVTERMLPIAVKKKITIIADSAGSEIPVWGDRDQLTQLLVILLDNAVKYSNAGTFVRVRPIKKETQGIIRVVDQGIGIPDEEKDKIFNRFYRVDKARSRAEGGTGLGLPIAKWIAEKHGGSIQVFNIQDELKQSGENPVVSRNDTVGPTGGNKIHTGTIMEVTLPLMIQEQTEKHLEKEWNY